MERFEEEKKTPNKSEHMEQQCSISVRLSYDDTTPHRMMTTTATILLLLLLLFYFCHFGANGAPQSIFKW